MSTNEELIVIGKITTAHGIRGDVKIALFLDDVDVLHELDSLFLDGRTLQEMKIKQLRFHKKHALVRFEGISDRTTAERLRGREVLLPFAWLPELEQDEYYVTQIIGLQVETVDGEPLGEITRVMFTGANEVYTVRDASGHDLLLPAIASVVQTVDLEQGKMIVVLPEGLRD